MFEYQTIEVNPMLSSLEAEIETAYAFMFREDKKFPYIIKCINSVPDLNKNFLLFDKMRKEMFDRYYLPEELTEVVINSTQQHFSLIYTKSRHLVTNIDEQFMSESTYRRAILHLRMNRH